MEWFQEWGHKWVIGIVFLGVWFGLIYSVHLFASIIIGVNEKVGKRSGGKS